MRSTAVAILVLPALLLSGPVLAASRLEKLGRILALEDSRAGAGPELEGYLHDKDPTVKRRAALAAGRLGDPTLTSNLVDLLNDPEPEVRQMAAFALGQIGGTPDSSAVDRLLASLEDSDSRVRARAAEALGRVGDRTVAPAVARFVRAAIPRQAPLLTIRGDDPGSADDPWLELRLGLFALARLEDPRAAAEALLLAGQPRFDWWAATYAAMKIASPQLEPVLVAAAVSTDPLSRALAARGFASLADESAQDQLVRLVRDPDENVAVQALRALSAIADARSLPVLASALGSNSLTVQREALEGLVAFPPDPTLAARVVPFLGHSRPWLRSAAFLALARMAPGDLPLALSGLDPDPHWAVRASKARALGMVGDELSLGILHSMLRDADTRVLPAVLAAIRAVRGADALPTLQDHLGHADPAVRAAAAKAIVELDVPDQSKRLSAAYSSSIADHDLGGRLTIVEALASLKGTGGAQEALADVVRRDPSRVIRARAAAALESLGEEGQRPGAETVRRPSLDFLEAMLPYDPRPGSPVYTPRAFFDTRHGRFEVRLNIVEAPLACDSFAMLARRGFYNGLTFHRVVPTFVVQGGCPRGDGNGGPGYVLRSEVGQRPFGRGTVGLAHSGRDTEGSQLFITLSPQPHLDGNFTVLGWVASGMEVVEQIQPGDVIERIEVWDGR